MNRVERALAGWAGHLAGRAAGQAIPPALAARLYEQAVRHIPDGPAPDPMQAADWLLRLAGQVAKDELLDGAVTRAWSQDVSDYAALVRDGQPPSGRQWALWLQLPRLMLAAGGFVACDDCRTWHPPGAGCSQPDPMPQTVRPALAPDRIPAGWRGDGAIPVDVSVNGSDDTSADVAGIRPITAWPQLRAGRLPAWWATICWHPLPARDHPHS